MSIQTFNKFQKVNEDVSVEIPTEFPQGLVPVFFGKLFHSRDVAHLIHLSTKSYEEHIALNEY